MPTQSRASRVPARRSRGTAVADGFTEGITRFYAPGDTDLLVNRARAVVHLKLLDPLWGGPTRTRIDDPRAGALIGTTAAEHLLQALDKRPDLQAQIEELLSRPQS